MKYNIEEENYEMTTDIDIDIFISELPIGLIKESLSEQIDDPLSSRINFIEPLYENIVMLMRSTEDEDDKTKLNSILLDVLNFIINKIDIKFKLGVDYDESNIKEVVDLSMTLYKYLILRYKKNISRFIFNFIIKNKALLVSTFDTGGRKKDVTTISMKKKIKNKEDLIILSNLPSIIKYIINLSFIDPIKFIEYTCKEEYYEGSMMKDFIEDQVITNNFISKYLELTLDEYDDVLDEIQTDIKIKIIDKK